MVQMMKSSEIEGVLRVLSMLRMMKTANINADTLKAQCLLTGRRQTRQILGE